MSHGSLLVRSPKSDVLPFNVDVTFVGVDYLATPRVLDGLTVEGGREDDRVALTGTLPEVDLEHLFVLVSAGQRHPVIAVACRVSENGADIFENSF